MIPVVPSCHFLLTLANVLKSFSNVVLSGTSGKVFVNHAQRFSPQFFCRILRQLMAQYFSVEQFWSID